jgi:hypothetical protein
MTAKTRTAHALPAIITNNSLDKMLRTSDGAGSAGAGSEARADSLSS